MYLFLIYDITLYYFLICISNIVILIKNLIDYKILGHYNTNFEIICGFFLSVLILNFDKFNINNPANALINRVE